MERDYKLLLAIGVLVFVVLIIGLVLADVLSTPTTEFNFNQSISDYYNITINKTLGPHANVSFIWINITLPNDFTFTVDTNATNSSNSPTFSNMTNASGNVVLMWVNSTAAGIMSTTDTAANFAFNATSPNPGNFTIWILTYDNNSQTNTTHVHVFINDTTAPNVTIDYPVNESGYSSTSINFNITVLDNYKLAPNGICWYTLNDFITNNTMTNTTTAPTVWNATNISIAEGNYVAKFWCNDTANNVNNSELVNFTIDTTNPEMSITYPTNNTNDSTGNLNYNFTEINPGFCWYSNNSGVSNSSTVAMGTNWTGLTAAEGDGNWTVYCNDSANNLNSTIIILFIMDTIAPTVSYSCTQEIVSHGAALTCSCSRSDTGGSGVETTISTEPNTQSYGTQTVSCTATDYAGNAASSSATFYVISGGGGTSSVGGYANTFVEDVKEFSEVGEITKSLGKKNRVRIKINNQEHYIGVQELTTTSATIEVSSTSQIVVFNIGDEKKFDVTEDGYYDLKIKLNSIESAKADVTITSINEKIPEGKEEDKGVVEKTIETLAQEGSNTWIWILIAIILVVIVVIYFLTKKK